MGTNSKSVARFDSMKLMNSLLMIAAGCVSGALASVLVARYAGSGERRYTEVPTPIAAPNSQSNDELVSVIAAQRTELDNMESRIAALDRAHASSPLARSTEATHSATASDAGSEAGRFEGALASHSQEPIDGAWARQTEGAFTADLTGLMKKVHGQLDSVDCRSSTCVAGLSFDTYSAARKASFGIVGNRYAENCVKTIFVPQPEDPSSPYQARVLFDCSSTRQ
jgi:hypothetical protein